MALRVEVVTPRGAVLAAEADEAVLPGVLGELGVLPGHLPLLAGLRPGVIRLRTAGTSRALAVGTGFVEVGAGDRVVVLVETCAQPGEVDVEDARRDLDEADRRLRGWSQETGAEFDRVVFDRAWAAARLQVASRE
jgi:F-type H+-transporting ATPase subunit epsilon